MSMNIWELHEEIGCERGESHACGCWFCAGCGRFYPCHRSAVPFELPHTGNPEEKAAEESLNEAIRQEAIRQIRDGEA